MGAIRTHVDVCDDRLLCVEALLEVKKKIAPYIELQIVAFPQDGFYRFKNRESRISFAPWIWASMSSAASRILNAPWMRDGLRVGALRDWPPSADCWSISIAMKPTIPCRAMSKRWPVKPSASGLQGRVVGSHLTSMHSMDNYYVSKLIPLMAEAQLPATPNPLINITIQGRHDTYPKRRGLTRIPELRAAGINISFGHDCVMDPWYPLGRPTCSKWPAWACTWRR